MSSTGEPIKPYDCKVLIQSELRLLFVIRDRLLNSPERLRIFKETVFAPWIYIKEEAHNNHMLNYVLHHQRYDEFPSTEAPILFDIGEHMLQLGKKEFCLLTGFTCGKVVFDELKKDDIPPFIRRVFPEKIPGNGKKPSKSKKKGVPFNVKGWELKSLVEDEKRWEKLSDEDAVRVCLLLMEHRVFMGKEAKRGVDNRMIMLVEDLPAWNTFPWGEYFWLKFHKSVAKLVSKKIKSLQENPPGKATYTIYGFAWVLKIWILESFPNSYRWWVKDPDVIPRCLAWRNNISFNKDDYSQLFGTDSNPKTSLTPTIKEMKHEWCRKNYDYFDDYSQFAQVDNLESNVEREGEGEAVGNLQGIHSENENITLSSFDFSPMPSKPVTKRQALPTEVSDCRSKRLKLSCDHGDKELIDLNGQPQELVESVSPMRNCLVQVGPAPGEVSSPQSGIICVQGYKVKNVYAPILEAILNIYGDIASACVFPDADMRRSLLEAVCDIVGRIEMNDITNNMSSYEEIKRQLHVAEVAQIDVSWLQPHLDAIPKSYEAEKKATMLMELQTNTILVERAARSDLKESHAKLVAAQNEFAEVERCAEVLKILKKKLNNDVLESKAEKELLARKPVIYIR